MDDLADAFRTGIGLPYDRHGPSGVHQTERMLGPWARLRLVPTIVVRWYVASCAALRAGPPFSKTASSRLESPIPLVEPEALLAATEPSSEAKGTFAVTHAIWPDMLKLCV